MFQFQEIVMLNKSIAFFFSVFCTGCYSTAPTNWNKVRSASHDVVTVREVIPNGSRLDIRAVTQNGQIDITAKSIPQCRLADIGYESITERGQRNPHSWPGTMFGIGMMVGGTIMFADGLDSSDSDSRDRKDTRIAETIGGIAIVAGGAILTGVCAFAINGCAADPDEDTRTYNGTPFKRWDERPEVVKKDCESSPSQPAGIVHLQISAFWETTKTSLTWNIDTDARGIVTLRILDTVRRVSAHCGKAKIEITSSKENKEDRKDSPAYPSQERNESGGYRLNFSQVTKLESPDLIKSDDARKIAQTCFDEKRASCIGPRAKGIEDKCTRDCNSESGAEACQIEFETQLIPGITEDEQSVLNAKYRACVAGSGIDRGKASRCTSGCIEQTSKKVCPNGW